MRVYVTDSPGKFTESDLHSPPSPEVTLKCDLQVVRCEEVLHLLQANDYTQALNKHHASLVLSCVT